MSVTTLTQGWERRFKLEWTVDAHPAAPARSAATSRAKRAGTPRSCVFWCRRSTRLRLDYSLTQS